jgi:hypothetical protein
VLFCGIFKALRSVDAQTLYDNRVSTDLSLAVKLLLCSFSFHMSSLHCTYEVDLAFVPHSLALDILLAWVKIPFVSAGGHTFFRPLRELTMVRLKSLSGYVNPALILPFRVCILYFALNTDRS